MISIPDTKKLVALLTMVLAVIGSLAWGIIGLGYFLGFNLNIVNLLFGWFAPLENVVYILVGIFGGVLAVPAVYKYWKDNY